MNLTIEQLSALLKLYPQIVKNVDGVAYDADGNEVFYNLQVLTAKIAKDEADKIAQEQTQATAKTSALAKLAALGLTQDEVKALVG
jgi:hypothetical protein